MAGETKRYNANEITVDLGGRDLNRGTADGEFVAIEYQAPSVQHVTGTSGELVVSRDEGQDVALITIKLLQTSDANDVLEDLRLSNRRGPGLTFKPLRIRDRNGRAIHEAPHCIVQAPPTISYDRTGTVREWKLLAQLKSELRGTPAVG